MSRAFGDVIVGIATVGSGPQSRERSGSTIDGASSGVSVNCNYNKQESHVTE